MPRAELDLTISDLHAMLMLDPLLPIIPVHPTSSTLLIIRQFPIPTHHILATPPNRSLTLAIQSRVVILTILNADQSVGQPGFMQLDLRVIRGG